MSITHLLDDLIEESMIYAEEKKQHRMESNRTTKGKKKDEFLGLTVSTFSDDTFIGD